MVSRAFHNAKYGLHRKWNDHLNVADLCVVWGDNASMLDLNAFDFWNGQFTCNFTTGNDQGYSRDSSTTRDDTGNGACETIYIRQFEILESMDTGWRTAYSVSLFAVISTSLIGLIAVGRGTWK